MRKLKLLLVLSMVVMAASASKTVYLKPNSNWLQANARFAVLMYTGENAAWTDFTLVEGTENIYSAEFNEDYANMKFTRMNPETTENNLNEGVKWNISGELAAPAADGLLYTLGDGWDDMGCSVSIYGATAASFTEGKYLFKNVGSGRYLGPGTNYGTRASLLEQSHFNTLRIVSDGVFKIETQVSNGGTNYYLGLNGSSDMYMDNGGKNITINSIGNDKYVLSFEGESTYIGYDGTNKYTVHNLTDYSANNAQWTIVSYEDALAGATEENPVDATFMVLCQNFDRNNRSANAWTMVASNKNLCGGKDENKCAESWHATFTLSQTITVPNGYYKIRAQAAYGDANITDDNYPVIYADDATVNFFKMTDQSGGMDGFSTRFADGEYITAWSDMVTVTNKSITVGAKCTRTDAWCIWDNIQLMYYGPIDLSGYATALAEAVAAAEALEGTIPTVCYDAIAAVVAENNKTYNNEDDYLAAINAINNAISTNAPDNIKAAYARYTRIRTAVLAIKSDIDVTAADAAANAATTNTAIDAAVPTLRNALTTYLAGIEDQDIDLTDALIDNPSPGTAGNLDWWNTKEATGLGNNLYEFYNKTDASSRQTIPATMPAGYYKMTVIGYTREGYNANMFVDAGSGNVADQVLVGVAKSTVDNLSQGNTWIAAGNGVNEMIFNLENAADNFTIGIWAGDQGDKWTAWRSFKLEFLGTTPLFVFDEMLTAAIANGRTTVEELAVPAGVKSTFNTYADEIAAAKANYTTPAQFNDAINNIAVAVEAAKEAVAPTAENAFVLAKATAAITELAGLADADKATLQGVIDGNDEALAACADAAAVEAQNNALWAAIGVAINSIPVTDKLDLTFLLTNPNVDSFYTGQYNVHVDGWYTEQEGGNFQVVPGEGCANADGVHKHAYEYWSENPRANNLFTLYQKLQLPEGTYAIDCYAFADQPTGGDVHGIYFYANDTQGSCVTTNTLAEQGISFVNDAQQEVKIGLKAVEGNTYRWMGIGYMQLFKVPAQTFTINEGEDYDTTQEGAGAVTLTRTIKADTWNTIWLPFSMTEAELKATFGDDVEIAQFSESANANVPGQSTINFNKSDKAISPNVPVLLKTSTAGTEYTIEGRTIVAGTPTTAGTNFDFVGTTAASTLVAEGDYFIGSNKLYASTGNTTLKGTRAYLKGKTEGARILNFSIDGNETTAIENLEQGTISTGKVFNLQGQEVKSAQKGIFIQNGKKVVIK